MKTKFSSWGYNRKKTKIDLKFSGTKWCSPDYAPLNSDDLGLFVNLDACCRDHERCSTQIIDHESMSNPADKNREKFYM